EIGSNIAEPLAEALEPGWFRDRMAARLATRVGDQDLLAAATAAQAMRSDRLLVRMRATVVVELVLIGIGLVLLVRVVVRRRALDRIGGAVLPPPWRGLSGVLVLVWGGALGSLLILVSSFLPDRAYSRVLIGATTNLSFVPLIFLAWLFLLRPSSLRLSESFGLVPTSAVAHGYGALGFAAVFWSGLLWAWSFERTGSLLPSMAAHAADNLMASLSVILVLRG